MFDRIPPLLCLLACLPVACMSLELPAAEPDAYDVVVYGGTSAGITAAIQVRRMGKSVVLIEPGRHLGGLTVSGLGMTDTGNKAVICGLAREFYQHVKQHYDEDSAWRQEQRAKYDRYRPQDDAMWTFEPHVAEGIFQRMLRDAGVPIVTEEGLERTRGVEKQGATIISITMKSGRKFLGKRFIDATYEGDLMAAAGVTYTVGREANQQYGETLNGVQIANAIHHQFVKPVDPYVRPGDPSSGLLPGINTSPGQDGEADRRMQAYNYRICMTDAKENQIPFEKPDGYDPLWHELLLRNFEAGDLRLPLSLGMMPNRKTDLNNNFAVSTDWIGMNYDYPEADDEARLKILQDHETYIRGFLWTLAHHPRVPDQIRRQASRWGYAKDEFTDNRGWPYWCYIREARRMVGAYVQTELDCRRVRQCDDSVGLGSYNMDSHNCQRYVDEHGHVRNEGDVQVSPRGPYLISYRSIVPKRDECENLFVPVCLSSTHIAYGSIRMEPVFMILGQSAGTAACQSMDAGQPVQDVSYARLRERLLADKQVLDLPAGSIPSRQINPGQLSGIVQDDAAAKKTGVWLPSSSINGFVGEAYLHDENAGQGEKSVTYTFSDLPAGTYEVRMSYTASGNRASNVPVTITSGQETTTVNVNERRPPPIDGLFFSLGEFPCAGLLTITISNRGADGYVVADAVQLLKK